MTLTDAEVADVLTYVMNSFGNELGPVSPTDVKRARAENP
jgi:mono/diheme cytochrome c family protein